MRKGRSIGIVSRFKNRQGFALILVFSLASIVLLIGLSLVSLTQVETASNQYDQGLRVARANARLALQMAIGDLQTLAGPDQRATATADGARTPTSDDFNDAADGSTSGVYQPFWTGVWDVNNATDNPRWLVTRPLDATYALDTGIQDADPFVRDLGSKNDSVKLVGAGTAEPEPGFTQDFHDVEVPKEPIVSDNIVGLADTEEATIGHYAYWVGDNGVKASYLLENQLPETLHDDYDDSFTTSYEKERLEQMLAHRYRIERAGAEMDATDARIASIVNEFVLRNAVDGTGGTDSYLGIASGTFTQNDVRSRFHDFSGLHRGLLVDPIRGGLREDLSDIHSVGTGDSNLDDLVNNFLMPYLNVSDIVSSSTPLTDLTRSYPISAGSKSFTGIGPTPTVAPVIAGLKLGIRVRAPNLEPSTETSEVMGQLELSVKLWNPYTSYLEGEAIVIRLLNAFDGVGFRAIYSRSGFPDEISAAVEVSELMNDVIEFRVEAPPLNGWWAPGEIRSFVGVLVPGEPILSLTSSISAPTDDISSYYAIPALPPYTSRALQPSSRGDINDKIKFDIPEWSPRFSMEIDGEEVAIYELSGLSYQAMNPSAGLAAVFDATPNIAYVWNLRSPLYASPAWETFDPRSGKLDGALLGPSFVDDFQFPGKQEALSFFFKSSNTELLGFNNFADQLENNIPLFELPRQEYLSLAALQTAEFPSRKRGHLGSSSSGLSVTASINEVFDRFFLSTVPQSGSTSWTVGNPLPNSRMQPLAGTSLADLQDPDSAGHLFLNGSFNVNSTSIEAWGALVKGIRLGSWSYDDSGNEYDPPGIIDDLELTDENQFFRFSQSAEETWLGSYDATDLSRSREFFRKGMRSLTDAEVEGLAVEIVNQIRIRRQSGLGGGVGPFTGLQDFIDSGVIELAIANTTINSSVVVNSVPLTCASSYLTQQDVLTAIAPYLTTRSDTFVIRAYGDAVNPFDATEIVARAYCEALVQRVHQKHPSEPDVSDPMTIAGANPGEFGRQFRVIAFRWMTGDEI